MDMVNVDMQEDDVRAEDVTPDRERGICLEMVSSKSYIPDYHGILFQSIWTSQNSFKNKKIFKNKQFSSKNSFLLIALKWYDAG